MLAEYRRNYYIKLKQELQGGSIKFQFLTIRAVRNAIILGQPDTFEKISIRPCSEKCFFPLLFSNMEIFLIFVRMGQIGVGHCIICH